MLAYLKENAAFVVIVTVLIGGFIVLIVINRTTSTQQTRDSIKSITGVKEYDISQRNHVQGTVDYAQSPPAGGNHAPVWVGCNAQNYDNPIQDEMGVHALEHGAAWITYQPSLPADQVKTLKDKVIATGGYSFSAPYESLKSPITLTSWGAQLSVQNANDPRIEQFLTKYRLGSKTPEPGATCASPTGNM